MKKPVAEKSSTSKTASWQRAYRARMREQGLVPIQVYIRVEHTELLKTTERILRETALPSSFRPLEAMSAMSHPWNTESLNDALIAHIAETGEALQVHLLRGAEPVIEVICPEQGGLALHMTSSGVRIFVSTVLCHADSVADRNAFNDACLRLNPINPLSNIGLQSTPSGDLYTVFGELSARSPLISIVEEIHVLAHNALQATDALRSYIH